MKFTKWSSILGIMMEKGGGGIVNNLYNITIFIPGAIAFVSSKMQLILLNNFRPLYPTPPQVWAHFNDYGVSRDLSSFPLFPLCPFSIFSNIIVSCLKRSSTHQNYLGISSHFFCFNFYTWFKNNELLAQCH